ncbi:SPASM domain-containing protein [Candidatus Pelagibacter sp.]|jgi:radical SAM protein with 4Fe4S-binding SPASM domain|nr:SPASM domain-containing protein [Candidatus Pelagibacter sp.]|tara:strand:+ start:5371 stop:6237 length:867 start_codon:yes stop_codon:yes gene_type:complete
MNPKETIKKNLERRSKSVDLVSLYKEVPMPTWVELSLIDVCNRKCSFCPKSDDKVAPDTYQKMSKSLIDKIHDQLFEMNFSGTISICGYGEPLLHKDINYIVEKLSNISNVEIVTNGDVLSSKRLQELYIAKVGKVLISMYDGPEQIERFQDMTKRANVPEELVILRDRWYDKHNDFGVKLTNRAGTVDTGDQEEIGKYTKCYYPSYQFLIDWNGDIFLCPQDWHRRVSMGNMMQESIFNIWTGKILTDYRKNLILGRRSSGPCKMCNANGALLGKNHAEKWKDIYKI